MAVSYLHFRSSFSLLRGCRSPEEICRLSRERGLSAVALADVNNFYGLIRFLQAAGREGIKPIAGVTVERKGQELFTAYVMNRAGFSNICRVLTGMLTDEGFDPVEALAREGWEGLSLLSRRHDVLARLAALRGAAGTSPCPPALQHSSGVPTSAPRRLPAPKGLFVELRYGEPFAALARFSRESGLPPIAVADTVFFDDEDERLYPLLRAIDLNVTLEHVPAVEAAGPGRRFVAPEAVERFFSAVPEALSNARTVAEEASAEGIIRPHYVFPSFDGLSDADTFRLLVRLCEEGAVRRYGAAAVRPAADAVVLPGGEAAAPGNGAAARPWGGNPRPDIRQRLDYELAIIREKGFASYFLVVRDIVQQCPRTCGRGSAASSIVSYLLGITHVDPLRYTLFFERFLNRGRKDPPDIDVDFPWDERDAVLRFVFQKHAGKAAMVANHVTFGPRSALRDPAKAMGIPEEEIGELVRLFKLGRVEELPPYLREAAARLRGMPRNLGTHCGGVVITPGPITNYTHVQTSPLGYPVIAWEKDATEEAGLVKIDLLGNRSLGVLRDTLALVEKNHGVRLDWESFDPLRDPETRDLIAAGKTLGVFYVESPATRQLLTKMERGDYENLVIASSIIRPAANQYIRTFVKRLHGAPYRPLHPLIEGTLAETCGVMVYQEDVSRVAIDLAGFSIEDADRLRKILTKKDRELRLPDFREKFFRSGAARGVEEGALEKAWDMILSFDGYSFCKAHSASYAQVSYRLAYLKRFYPLEFIASVINNGGGFYGRQTYVDECRRMGFPVRAPDVNASRWEYTVEGGAGAAGEAAARPGGGAAARPRDGTPCPGDGTAVREAAAATPCLRVGLGQLRDLSRPFIESLIAERERGGPFAGFHDLLSRTRPRYSELRTLIRSGALDSISEGCTRPQLFFRYQNAEREEGFGFVAPAPPAVGDYPQGVKIRDEVETLGLMVSRHPLALFRRRIAAMVEKHRLAPFLRSSTEIPRWRGKRVWISGILVTGKEVATKKREPMIFVSFEDEESVFETVLFPDAFRAYYPILDGGWAFLVHGRVEEDLGALAVSVEKLVALSRQDATGAGAAERPPVFLWGYGNADEYAAAGG
jgi:error-prone DNA polymerase